MGWGGGRIGLMERKRGRREGGGEVYASVVCCCGAHWEYGASLSLFSWDQHGLMVYYVSALCGGARFAIRVLWQLYITVLQI